VRLFVKCHLDGQPRSHFQAVSFPFPIFHHRRTLHPPVYDGTLSPSVWSHFHPHPRPAYFQHKGLAHFSYSVASVYLGFPTSPCLCVSPFFISPLLLATKWPSQCIISTFSKPATRLPRYILWVTLVPFFERVPVATLNVYHCTGISNGVQDGFLET